MDNLFLQKRIVNPDSPLFASVHQRARTVDSYMVDSRNIPGGVLSENFGLGCAARFLKQLPRPYPLEIFPDASLTGNTIRK